MEITFHPAQSPLLGKDTCKKIAFAQVVRYKVDGKAVSPVEYKGKYGGASLAPFVTDGDFFLDGADDQPKTPDYQQADNQALKPETKQDFGQLGKKIGKVTTVSVLRDRPETGGPVGQNGWKEMVIELESFAYCEEGGKFFEGITWEYRKKSTDTYGSIKMIATDLPKPSLTFVAAFNKFRDVRGYKPDKK